MKAWKFDQKFELKVTSIILSLFIIFGIMSGYIERFVKLPASWEIPIILASLLMITRMLSTLYNVDENIKKLIRKVDWVEVKRYDTYGKFYKDLEKAAS